MTIDGTHDQVEAITLAQTIVVPNARRIEQVGAPLDLHHQPAKLFIAGFIGSPQMNLRTSEVRHTRFVPLTVRGPSGSKLDIPAKKDELKASDVVTIGIRPEHNAEHGRDAAPSFVDLALGQLRQLKVKAMVS